MNCAKRPLQTRQRPLVDHETGAGEFRRRLEVHEAQSLAKLEMLFRLEREFRLLAESMMLGIVVFILAVRNIRQRQVRDLGQRLVERGAGLALLGLEPGKPPFSSATSAFRASARAASLAAMA